MNNPNKHNTSFILRVVMIVAAFLTLCCIALPFYSYLGDLSGFSVIIDIVDSRHFPEFPEFFVILSLTASALCIILSFTTLTKPKMVIAPMLLSVASIAMMPMGLWDYEDPECLSTGFYLFMLMHLAIIILSFVVLCLPKQPEPCHTDS